MAISNKYKEIQCIGFSMQSGVKQNDYLGYKDDSKDIHEKIKLLKDAIDSAYKNMEVNRNNKCLKVFMLPEFYFRGANGAYKMDSIPKLNTQLRKLVNDPKYKDWLFIFGTTVATSDGISNRPDFRNAEIYNYTFIQKGNSGKHKSFTVMKEKSSSADFVNSLYPPRNKNPKDLSIYNTHPLEPVRKKTKTSKSYRNEEKIFNYDSNSVFEIDGIRIGMEICLDHLKNRLNNAILSSKKPIDLHLVSSSGVVDGFHSTNKLSPKGISFICDGADKGYSRVVNSKFKDLSPLKSYAFKPKDTDTFSHMFTPNTGRIKIFNTHRLDKKFERGMTI